MESSTIGASGALKPLSGGVSGENLGGRLGAFFAIVPEDVLLPPALGRAVLQLDSTVDVVITFPPNYDSEDSPLMNIQQNAPGSSRCWI